jgi:hypothetical protein
MKWYKTSEILPENNRQLLLLIDADIRYTNCYQIGPCNVVMGVYMKREIPNLIDPNVYQESEYYFELLCCEIHYSINKIRAWSYVPSVSEIEASFLNLQ